MSCDALDVTIPPPPVAQTLEEANEIIARLYQRIVELEARLSANSTNSSRPPSSDALWSKGKRKPPSGPSGRKAGGQPGHVGRAREPVPPERVDEFVDVHPERCGVCGAELPPDVPSEDAYAHQVTDLPEAPARVTEYRLWRKRCPHCGGRTRAKRPAHVPEDAFGPRLKAVITALTAKYRVSRREMVEVLRDLFGVQISVGSIQATCERVGVAVAPAVEAVRQEVASAPVAHADETGWRQHGRMRWLWGATTPDAAYFVVAPDRGRAALSQLLPDGFKGVVQCDRWRPYERFGDARQLCHAHLRRDFQAAIDRGGIARPLGRRLLAASDDLFHVWHAYQRGDIDRPRMVRDMVSIEKAWDAAVTAATETSDHRLAVLSADLWRQWDCLWTFVRVEGVEPTNNDAERALRPAVLWRKGCFGTRSDGGSTFVARMLTVVHTAKRRRVDLVPWLRDACENAAAGLAPAPLLSG